MSSIKERKVVIIGDLESCLIGVAAGIDYYVFKEDCSELSRFIQSGAENYGVFIVLNQVIEKCPSVKSLLDSLDALVVKLDYPSVMKMVEPRELYEKMIAKFVGKRIPL